MAPFTISLPRYPQSESPPVTEFRAICRSVLALVAILFLGGTAIADTDLFVAPDGNDTFSGKLAKPNAEKTDGPLASLAGARDAVRKLITAGKLDGPLRVCFTDGTYRITEPVVFTPEDSGTQKAPIVYEAAPGAKPVIDN